MQLGVSSAQLCPDLTACWEGMESAWYLYSDVELDRQVLDVTVGLVSPVSYRGHTLRWMRVSWREDRHRMDFGWHD